jgi:hypothetical protein
VLSSVSEFPYIFSHSRLSRPRNAPGLKQKVSRDFSISFYLLQFDLKGQFLLYFWSVYVFFVLSNISEIH